MGTLARGQEIVTALEAEGIRATLDPATAAAPCVVVIPPNLTADLSCTYTARWQLAAIAPAANTADRGSWEALDTLLDTCLKVLDIRTADLVAYTLNNRTYPAYLLSWEEAI